MKEKELTENLVSYLQQQHIKGEKDEEFKSMDVLYSTGIKLGVDFGDMVSIIRESIYE